MSEALDAADVRGLRARLASLPGGDDATALVDLLRELEDLKGAVCAAQAEIAVRLAGDASDLTAVVAQVGHARRESPAAATRLVEAAVACATDLPRVLGALRDGRLSERRALIVVREAAVLGPDARARLDEHLDARLDTEHGLGDRLLAEEVRNLAYALEPEAARVRADRAYAERRVTSRPGPDATTTLVAHLPALQAVAVHAALASAAEEARRAGDPRTRAQIMADTLVERITGAAGPFPGQVELGILMTDETLLGQSDRPAIVDGHGPVPARWIREMLEQADDDARVALRRLYRGPGRTIAMETSSRLFTAGMKKLVRWRDGICRTPWCNAPIRQHDHVRASAAGGTTSVVNQQGLCEWCNQAKLRLGWPTLPDPGGGVTTVAPTGHAYESRPRGPLARLEDDPPPPLSDSA